MSFSPEEITHFQVCFEEGYDLPDERYQQWVHMYHPESDCVRKSTILPCEQVFPPDCGGESASPPRESVSPPESVHVYESTSLPHESVSPPEIPERAKQTSNILQHSSVLSQLLTQRTPKVKYPQSKAKSCARVLTSSENLMLLEEKERKKEEAEESKEGRRKESKSDWHWRKQSTRRDWRGSVNSRKERGE